MGRQGQLGIYNFIGFWGVGVVCGYYLAFHVGWGLEGLWTGILMGVVITGCGHNLFVASCSGTRADLRRRLYSPLPLHHIWFHTCCSTQYENYEQLSWVARAFGPSCFGPTLHMNYSWADLPL